MATIPELAGAIREFSFRVLRESPTRSDESGVNVCHSPIALSLALLAVANCTSKGSKTWKEVVAVFDVDRLSTADQANILYRQYIYSLLRDTQGVFHVGNSLWIKPDINLNTRMLDVIRRYLNTDTLSLSPVNADEDINAWIDSTSKGKLPPLLTAAPEESLFAIFSIAYFSGSFSWPLTSLGEEGAFRPTDGQVEKCRYMKTDAGSSGQEEHFKYHKAEHCEVVQLRYGDPDKGKYGCVIVLPNEGISLTSLCQVLDHKRWEGWCKELKPTRGTVTIPQFRLVRSSSVGRVFRDLGVDSVFTEGKGDLENLTDVPEELFLESIHHQVAVEVSDAHCVLDRARLAVEGSDRGVQVADVVCDRPFLFVPVDIQFDVPLLVCKVESMSAEQGVTPLRGKKERGKKRKKKKQPKGFGKLSFKKSSSSSSSSSSGARGEEVEEDLAAKQRRNRKQGDRDNYVWG